MISVVSDVMALFDANKWFQLEILFSVGENNKNNKSLSEEQFFTQAIN